MISIFFLKFKHIYILPYLCFQQFSYFFTFLKFNLLFFPLKKSKTCPELPKVWKVLLWQTKVHSVIFFQFSLVFNTKLTFIYNFKLLVTNTRIGLNHTTKREYYTACNLDQKRTQPRRITSHIWLRKIHGDDTFGNQICRFFRFVNRLNVYFFTKIPCIYIFFAKTNHSFFSYQNSSI